MAQALVCDARECDTWEKQPPIDPQMWVKVDWGGDHYHFCCMWCCVREMSLRCEPTEVV
jgi:hypothetical protein